MMILLALMIFILTVIAIGLAIIVIIGTVQDLYVMNKNCLPSKNDEQIEKTKINSYKDKT